MMFNQSLFQLQDLIPLLGRVFYLIQIRDIADIILVSVAIYFVLIFIKQTKSFVLAYVFAGFIAVNYLARTLDLGLTRQIIQSFVALFALVILLAFQREIRRFFDWMFIFGRRLSKEKKISISNEKSFIIVKAVEEMSQKKIGSLIVFPGELPLDGLTEGGFALDGKISSQLLLSIFDTSSPGHDGAVIIDNNRLRRFGVHLPLAENYTSFAKAGTRHRAAVGITERSDALAIVVSEERGEISVALAGRLTLVSDMTILENQLRNFFQENLIDAPMNFWRQFLTKNIILKIAGLAIAAVCWFIFVFQPGVVNRDITVPLEFRFLDKKLAVVNSEPKDIVITLIGRERDFNNLTGDQIKAVLDIEELSAGSQKIEIVDANISRPKYLELIKINPKIITINIAMVGQ